MEEKPKEDLLKESKKEDVPKKDVGKEKIPENKLAAAIYINIFCLCMCAFSVCFKLMAKEGLGPIEYNAYKAPVLAISFLIGCLVQGINPFSKKDFQPGSRCLIISRGLIMLGGFLLNLTALTLLPLTI